MLSGSSDQTAVEIEVFPAQGNDLTHAGARHQQQPHDIRRHPVAWVGGLARRQRGAEAAELDIRQEAGALAACRFVKALNHSTRIATGSAAITPIFGQREHLAQQGQAAICRAPAAAHDAPTPQPGFLIEPRFAGGHVLHKAPQIGAGNVRNLPFA